MFPTCCYSRRGPSSAAQGHGGWAPSDAPRQPLFPCCVFSSFFCIAPCILPLEVLGGVGLVLCQLADLGGGIPQSHVVSTLNLEVAVDPDALGVLEEGEGWHRRDLVLLGEGGDAVDVDLGKGEEFGDRVLRRQLFVLGRDGLARWAPIGVEVGNDILRRLEQRLELVRRVDVLDGAAHGGWMRWVLVVSVVFGSVVFWELGPIVRQGQDSRRWSQESR